jgi:transposase
MIIKKEDTYTLFLTKPELEIIADSLNGAIAQMREDDIPERQQDLRETVQLLKGFKGWVPFMLEIDNEEAAADT